MAASCLTSSNNGSLNEQLNIRQTMFVKICLTCLRLKVSPLVQDCRALVVEHTTMCLSWQKWRQCLSRGVWVWLFHSSVFPDIAKLKLVTDNSNNLFRLPMAFSSVTVSLSVLITFVPGQLFANLPALFPDPYFCWQFPNTFPILFSSDIKKVRPLLLLLNVHQFAYQPFLQ